MVAAAVSTHTFTVTRVVHDLLAGFTHRPGDLARRVTEDMSVGRAKSGPF